MSSLNSGNLQDHSKEHILFSEHQLPIITDHDIDSDNGVSDNNVTLNQSDYISSFSQSGVHENDRSGDLLIINDNTDDNINNRQFWDKKMSRLFTILIFLLGTYATFQNKPPKISKISASKPFFPKGSLVTDWPDGQLANAQLKVTLTDLSFVLFYAPWCAESQYARVSYEYVARMYYREAHFSAINCWQPLGECRAQYTKVMSWPVLMAYSQNGAAAVPYNGRWNSRELTQFVRALIKPLKRISNPSELLDLMAHCDAVVVAFVDLLVNRSHYSSFYKTSVKWIEKDPNQEVIFGIVTGEASRNFGVDATPVIRMYLWNDTMEYLNNTWTQPELTNWISTNIHQVSAWLSPPGTKSATLAPYLKRGPTVLFFTPRIHYTEGNDAYTMLRQIALEYYNCPSTNKDWIQEMSRDYMTEHRTKSQEHHKQFQETCRKLLKATSDRHSIGCSESTVSVTFANIVNTSSDKLPAHRIFGPIDEKSTCLSHQYNKYKDQSCDSAPTFVCSARSDKRVSAKHSISMLDVKTDDRCADSLFKRNLRMKCEIFSHGDEEHVIFFDDKDHDYDQEIDFDSISGLSCKSNRSLSFLAVDSLLYHIFAERLGIDVLKQSKKSALLIMDYENESTYILEDTINTNNVVNFVKKFHNKTLSRHLKSKPQKHVESSSTTTKRYIPIKKTITLKEINSNNFVEEVVSSNKTVAVLFYSTQCALCSLMSHTLMVASKILNDIDCIDFVRIDGDRNDLPWQYMIDKFPALLIFAENRKTESRIFPTHLQVNIQNVLGFLLANMNRPTRLHALVLICQNIHVSVTEKTSPHDDCFPVLRNEITDSISYSLKQWRNVPHHRSQIYRRLQVLQRMYLHLFKITVSCDFNELIGYVNDIRRVWTMM